MLIISILPKCDQFKFRDWVQCKWQSPNMDKFLDTTFPGIEGDEVAIHLICCKHCNDENGYLARFYYIAYHQFCSQRLSFPLSQPWLS